jgi:hypothetical protein
MFHKRSASLLGRTAPPANRRSTGINAMHAATDPAPLRSGWSGPTAAVLVALAGAALVAIGLLLVGTRESRVGLWVPPMQAMSAATTG